MSCCVENEGSTLKVTLTFKRDQLLYDIKNYAYVESHVMPPDTEHAKHMVADVGEEGNVDRVTRVLDLGVSMCRELLYPWAKKDIVNTELEHHKSCQERDVACQGSGGRDGDTNRHSFANGAYTDKATLLGLIPKDKSRGASRIPALFVT